MSLNSLDIVCAYDKSEINNVFLQTKKEIANRYDFKNTSCSIEWLEHQNGFKITANNQMQLDAIIEIIRKKLATRNLSQKIINFSQNTITSNLKITQELPIKHSLNKDNLTEISKLIKQNYPKIKHTQTTDSLRISSSSRDELQSLINFLKNQPFNFAIQFTNFK